MDAYGTLVDEAEKYDQKIDANREVLDKAAKQYMDTCNEYLSGQNQKMKDEIKAGADEVKLDERLKKITIVNDIIDVGNATRIAAWRSQAERSPKIIEDARKNFDVMAAKFNELRKMTSKQADMQRIDDTSAAAESYKSAMNGLLKNWLALQEVNKKQGEIGDAVLAAAQLTARDGMERTDKIAGQIGRAHV